MNGPPYNTMNVQNSTIMPCSANAKINNYDAKTYAKAANRTKGKLLLKEMGVVALIYKDLQIKVCLQILHSLILLLMNVLLKCWQI